MEKIYIIRKIVFFHNDLENVYGGLGDIVGAFDGYDQAYEAYLTCERYQHQQNYISNFEIRKTTGEGLLKKMQQFFQKYFPQVAHFREITQIPTLPIEADLVQTAVFIKLSGLQHYDLSMHEKTPTYYKIETVDDFWGAQDEFPFTVFPTEVSGLYFLQESEEKATCEALNIVYSYLWQDMIEETNCNFIGLQGKLTDLCRTPDVLETYLQSCKNFWYDAEKYKICFSFQTENDTLILKELTGLFDLLILKPFHILKIEVESIKNKPVKIEKGNYLP